MTPAEHKKKQKKKRDGGIQLINPPPYNSVRVCMKASLHFVFAMCFTLQTIKCQGRTSVCVGFFLFCFFCLTENKGEEFICLTAQTLNL